MAVFEVTGPDGQVYEIEGENQAGAMAAFQQYMQSNPVLQNPDTTLENAAGLNTPPGQMPKGYFTDPRQSYTNPQTGETVEGVTSRDRLAEKPAGFLEALGQGFTQGYSLKGGDELMGSVAGAVGGDKDFTTEYSRARYDASMRDRPGLTFASELTGSLVSPGGISGKSKTLFGAARSGAVKGGIGGGVAGFAGSEGGVDARLEGLGDGAFVGTLFGAASPYALQAVKGLGNKTYEALWRRSAKEPISSNLKATADASFDMLEKSGHRYSNDMIDDLQLRILGAQDEWNYTGQEAHIEAALKVLEPFTTNKWQAKYPKGMSVGQLQTLYQDMFRVYKKGLGPNDKNYDPRIGKMLDAIDDTIKSHPSTDDLYRTAKADWAKYKKTLAIEEAFDRANRGTNISGSGGNSANNYKRAINQIINNKRLSGFFADKELEVMKDFVNGGYDDKLTRLVGKMSPSGNGLMLTMHALMGAQTGGATLPLAGAGALAKASADNQVNQTADRILDYISSGKNNVANTQSAPGLGYLFGGGQGNTEGN